MANGKFASTGVIVGQTPQTRNDKKTEHLKGTKVTMGKNAPHQSEGAVGDITVRDVASIGLRIYVKTNSGWFDINSLIATFRINWININYSLNDSSTSGWIDNLAAAGGRKAQYCKDANGFVHFRGCIINLKISDTTPSGGSLSGAWQASQTHTNVSQTSTSDNGTGIVCNIETDGSGNPEFTLVDLGDTYQAGETCTFTDPGNTVNTAIITLADGGASNKNDTITTLPVGFRPYSTVIVPAAHVTAAACIKITSAGVVSGIGATTDTSAQFLDGVSFFAQQRVTSIGAGSTVTQEQFPGGFPVL